MGDSILADNLRLVFDEQYDYDPFAYDITTHDDYDHHDDTHHDTHHCDDHNSNGTITITTVIAFLDPRATRFITDGLALDLQATCSNDTDEPNRDSSLVLDMDLHDGARGPPRACEVASLPIVSGMPRQRRWISHTSAQF